MLARHRIDQAGIAAQHDSIDSFLQEFSGFVPQTRSAYPEPSRSGRDDRSGYIGGGAGRERQPRPPSPQPPLSGRRAPPRPHFARDGGGKYEYKSNTTETPRGAAGGGFGVDRETQRVLHGFATKGLPGVQQTPDDVGELFEVAPPVFVKAQATPPQRHMIPSGSQMIHSSPRDAAVAHGTPSRQAQTPSIQPIAP
jgi:hypothetical protein